MKIKVGIIGAGRIGKKHMEALRKIDGADIICVCDVLAEAAETTADLYSARGYTDHREMLEKEKPDAVWICTPASAHTENVLSCLDKKTPFFLEKPVSLDEDEADVVRERIEKEGIYHSVGYFLRYSPMVEKMKEMLGEEQAVFSSAEYFWTRPLVDTIKSKEIAGGQIVDQGTHLIDLMRHLVGEIKTVYTAGSRGFFPEDEKYTGDDASASVLEFEEGIAGCLLCSYALFSGITKYYPPKLRIICKNKLLEYADFNLNVIYPGGARNFERKADLFYLEDKAFIDGLIRGAGSVERITYADALETLKVCLAANRSMETGEKQILR